ncbi:hypothetical protein Taro_041239 [Colocasia esculenta]|uniref:Exocyst subunit Exo70 family protein n=1 Tax=Colocasia esculenta TaxID=4460 RepID=A0A843WWQ9_COLES|nr:hypothetical protein [Colocasia esculenta]
MDLAATRRTNDIEDWLDAMEEKLLRWDPERLVSWDAESIEASEYLQAIDEVRRFTEDQETLQSNNVRLQENENLSRAHSILQMAMARLEDEFAHLLIQHRQPLELDHTSLWTVEEDVVEDYSNNSFNDESLEFKHQIDSARSSERFVIDLIEPNVIADLKSIADAMFMSNYDKECCQAYISIRKDVLDECLSVLHVEKLSIEEALTIDWDVFSTKIKKWNRAMKVYIRVYLASERSLCDQIFGDLSKSVSETCFLDASKGTMLQLLNFGEAISIAPPSSERIFRLLDMYECLAVLMPDVRDLFPEESGSDILSGCHGVLWRLGDSIRATLSEFKNAIKKETSTIPFAGGSVHHLTRYVMNYINVLTEYRETLDLLLGGQDAKEAAPLSEDSGELGSFSSISPLGHCLMSVTSVLETKLHGKSMMYTDASLQHFFMMNNICYMVKKVKESDLREMLGDDWIRAHNVKFRQHAMHYERISWNPILSFLKDDGIFSQGSSHPSKTVLKERFKCFNLAFEEIYKTQTSWQTYDGQLREDLRISISLRLLQAYRTFTGRYQGYLDGVRHREKYIKFCQDDLQDYLLDLFEGSAKSIHIPRRR